MSRRMPAMLALALAGAQAGHLLAYQIRFGPAAQQVQSSGAHTYFPTVVKTSLGAAALTLIAGLLVVGVARVLTTGHRLRTAGGPSFLSVLAALFTIQLAWFIAQEVGEALIAGVPPDSAPNLLLWGTLGQLPVAVVATTAMGWLWSRVEAATGELVSLTRPEPAAPVAFPVVAVAVNDGDRAVVLAHRSHSPFIKRGPPTSTLIRTI